ncbi:interferon-stimulated 20 kDa exonuclease-like 2 [Bombina bombina]|uniref:interferon-stimulated 20 kDa exonuclease-like 2 n=1 Tax=Bombina bombina TaxID=8345 RepID=UPI00235B2063|nr:interferon-stimulated 20 kDa exonuclease-like 2 [Bombina bombina]
MADTFINLDFSGNQSGGRSQYANQKHQRFVKRRRFLERKGFLKQKQLPGRQGFGGQNRNFQNQRNSWDQGNNRGQQDDRLNHLNGHKKPRNTAEIRQEVTFTATRPAPQLDTITVSVDSGPHPSRLTYISKGAFSKAHSSSESTVANSVFGPKKHIQSFSETQKVNLLSEFESGLPPGPSATNKSYKMVAIDCEMVGTGPKGCNSDLARCSIVNYHGDVVYDKYIQPGNPVTDYRTRWSGIRREHLVKATPFKIAQKEILKILGGKLVIGHAIQNDFKALKYFHPKELTRDTSKIPLLNRKAGFPEKEIASLKRLAKQLLHKDIQVGQKGHSSVEDAKTTMELYHIVEVEWEREIAAGHVPQ